MVNIVSRVQAAAKLDPIKRLEATPTAFFGMAGALAKQARKQQGSNGTTPAPGMDYGSAKTVNSRGTKTAPRGTTSTLVGAGVSTAPGSELRPKIKDWT